MGGIALLKENIRAVLGEDITGKVEEIDKEIKHRQAELLRPGNNDKQIEKIGDAITYLRESRQEILTEAALKKDTWDRIENMMRQYVMTPTFVISWIYLYTGDCKNQW